MKRPDDKPLTCRFCSKAIAASDKITRTAAGPMHAACCDENLEKIRRKWDEAIAEGTHTERTDHFCGVCRRIVASIFHIGFDGTRMCPACADSHAGAGPKSWEKQQRERAAKWERQQRERQQQRTVAA